MAGIEAFFEEQDPEDVTIINPTDPPVTVVVEPASTDPVVAPVTDPVVPPTTDPVVPAIPPVTPEPAKVEPTVPVTPATTPGDGSQVLETLNMMRQLLQEQAQKIAELEGRSTGLTKVLTESGHIDESDINLPVTDVGLSEERVGALDILRETMLMNPTYSDLNEVCSQENYNQTVEALAKMAVQEEGGTLTDQIKNVSQYIWGLPNPYKLVYDIVKQNHPKYATPPATTPAGRTPPKPPTTIATIPGGAPPPASGWTAAKIDAMPEDELHQVPEAVYEKYMRNELP